MADASVSTRQAVVIGVKRRVVKENGERSGDKNEKEMGSERRVVSSAEKSRVCQGVATRVLAIRGLSVPRFFRFRAAVIRNSQVSTIAAAPTRVFSRLIALTDLSYGVVLELRIVNQSSIVWATHTVH